MAFLTDTFTEASDTAIGSHTSDSGHTWTIYAGGLTVIGSEDRLRGDSAGGSGVAISSASPASDQYDVEGVVRRTTSDANALSGIYARFNTVGPDLIQLYMSHSDSTLTLQEVQDNAVVESSTYSKSWSADTNYTIKLEVRNGSNGVKGYLDGVQRVQITWSGDSTPGNVAVRSRLYGRIDNLTATDYSAGVTLDCTVGNAVAAGSQANVSAGTTINASVGNAAAAGSQANISAGTTINASVGNAVAEGAQASITSGTTLDCTVGNAVAAGAQATISAGTTINAGVGNAVAAGVQASITTGFTLECTVGNAVAAGVQAGISIGSGTVTIACAVGNAVAAGVDVDIWSADPLLPRSRRIGGEILQAADDDVVARAPSRRIGGPVLRKPA